MLNKWAAKSPPAGKSPFCCRSSTTSPEPERAPSTTSFPFAAFKVTGWKFSGDSGLPYTFRSDNRPAPYHCDECKGNCRGIIGKFVKYVSLADGYTLGPVDAYGATVVSAASPCSSVIPNAQEQFSEVSVVGRSGGSSRWPSWAPCS